MVLPQHQSVVLFGDDLWQKFGLQIASVQEENVANSPLEEMPRIISQDPVNVNREAFLEAISPALSENLNTSDKFCTAPNSTISFQLNDESPTWVNQYPIRLPAHSRGTSGRLAQTWGHWPCSRRHQV